MKYNKKVSPITQEMFPLMEKTLQKLNGQYSHLFNFMNLVIVYGREWLIADDTQAKNLLEMSVTVLNST